MYAVSIWESTLVGWWHLHFLLTAYLLDICKFSFIEIMIVISDYLQNLNLTASSAKSWVFFIVFTNCETVYNLTCWWLSCTIWFFSHSFELRWDAGFELNFVCNRFAVQTLLWSFFQAVKKRLFSNPKLFIINDSHMEELVLYWIQYRNWLKYKVGCFWRFSYVYIIN